MMRISALVLEFAAAAVLLLDVGCARQRTVYAREPAPAPAPTFASNKSIIREAPPAPQVEVVSSTPGPEYVWVPGCWEWRGSWHWVGGHFAVTPYPDARWVPGRWTKREQSYVWIRGYWR
jgi:hypothetical protein